MANQISLDGTWQLTYGLQRQDGPRSPQELGRAGWRTIPAAVPGNVELDLMAAGELGDITVGNRIYDLRQWEGHEWWYRRSFAAAAAAPGQRFELVFDGLDCIATVWLNDEQVGSASNMFIQHRFDVTSHLRHDRPNELVVRLASAVLEGRGRTVEAVEWAQNIQYESLAIRKAPHMYGWDIMPRLVSAGLWRSVWLEIAPPTRLVSAYWATLATDPASGAASALLHWDFITDRANVDGLRMRITLARQGKIAHQSEQPVMGTHGHLRLDLTGVDLWWPRGYGAPTLYEATLELLDETGAVIDARRENVGLRTVELRRSEVTTTEEPGEFRFRVNGQDIFVKGTNWVPLDGLHSRDAQHLPGVFEMMVDLNCNMVRCWGGNVYEDHAFFDLCDSHGVMVWQDFAMACAIYPQTDDFAGVIRREAESVIRKLRNHPSLVLWAGNNEIDETYQWSLTGVDPNSDRLSRGVLPEVVRRLDPLRAYLPSSPYRSPELIRRGNRMEMQPEQHLWGPRDDYKGQFYTGSLAHFASEVGYHGCPDRASLEQFLDAEFLWPWQENDQWLTHSARPHPHFTDWNYRIGLMARQIAVLFDGVPDNLDDFILASQISQAEAKKFFIEWFRQGRWRRTGILWWNLRDGWPIISDAIVDYYNRKKLAYPYIRRVQADVCAIVCEPQAGRHELMVVNDTLHPAEGRVTVRDADSAETLLEGTYIAPANGSAVAGKIAQASQPAMWLIEWTVGLTNFRNHYLAGSRPFRLADYRRWLDKLAIAADVGEKQ